MLYFDTSFLAPLIKAEATSARVERFIAKLPNNELAVSHWARVEFSSVLAREVRMGGLSRSAADMAEAQFELMVQQSFIVLLPNVSDCDLAKSYLRQYDSGLRGGDALHLAIAMNNGCRIIYTLDKKLLKTGKRLGLPVSSGIRISK